MSDPSQKYDLTNGPFALCSGVWDTQEKIFKSANLTEQAECCVETCLPTIVECRKICSEIHTDTDTDKYQSCMQKCDVNLKNVCENNCRLISPMHLGILNPIYKGTTESGCGDGYYTNINIDCLKNNRREIIKSCRTNCIPSHNVNCDVLCNHSYNELENPSKNILYRVNHEYSLKGLQKNGTPGVSIFFCYSIIITLLLLISTQILARGS